MSAVVSGLIGVEDASNVYENSLEALVKARDAAWARVAKAERSAALYGVFDEVDAARQALRDLGVDVDALLGEP